MKKEMKAAGIFAKAGEKKLAAHERREAMGKEKDTPAIAKKEMSVLKKAKAPKDVMKYEKAEHKAMGFARGGGIESKGKTRGTIVKMARGGGIESRGKTRGKFFAEGGEVDTPAYKDWLDSINDGVSNAPAKRDELEEVTPTARKSIKAVQIDEAPETFKQAFARHRAAGDKGFTWNGKKFTTEMASNKPKSSEPVADSPMSSGPTSRKALGRAESKPAAKPDEVAMARARGGYPDYSNKDVRKGAVEGTLKGAELASYAAGAGGAGRAALGAFRARAAREGQKAASRAGVQAFKKDVAEARAQESKKDIMEGMDKLRAERAKRDAVKADEDMGWFAKGGSVKKFARGGGIESKGKTRGRFI